MKKHLEEAPVHAEHTTEKFSHNPRSKLALNWLLPFIMAFFLLATFFIIANDYHDWGGDFSLYINQSKALLNGSVAQIHAINKFGLENSTLADRSYTPEMFPWGWPILLTPAIKLFGQDYFWLKLYMMFFLVAIIGASYVLFRKKIGTMYSLIIVLCITLNPVLINQTKQVLSGFPYLFFVLVSLILHKQVTKSQNWGFWKLLLMIFVFFLASIIRTEGILLVGAVFVTYFVNWAKTRFNKAYLIGNQWILIFFSGYLFFQIIYQYTLPSGIPSHAEHLRFVSIDRVHNNFLACLNSVSNCFSSFLGTTFAFISLPFAFLGAYKRRKKDLLIVIYFFMHLVILLIWPYHDSRYIYMIIPFYFYFLMVGLLSLKLDIQLRNTKVSLATISFIAIISLLCIDYYNKIIPQAWQSVIVEGPETGDAKEMFQYINTHTKNKDIIVFFKPRVMSLYTGRKSLIVHDNPKKIKTLGDYLILHKMFGDYLQQSSLLFRTPEWLNLKYENSRFLVYKVEK